MRKVVCFFQMLNRICVSGSLLSFVFEGILHRFQFAEEAAVLLETTIVPKMRCVARNKASGVKSSLVTIVPPVPVTVSTLEVTPVKSTLREDVVTPAKSDDLRETDVFAESAEHFAVPQRRTKGQSQQARSSGSGAVPKPPVSAPLSAPPPSPFGAFMQSVNSAIVPASPLSQTMLQFGNALELQIAEGERPLHRVCNFVFSPLCSGARGASREARLHCLSVLCCFFQASQGESLFPKAPLWCW